MSGGLRNALHLAALLLAWGASPGLGVSAPPTRDTVAAVNGQPLPRVAFDRAFLKLAEHYVRFGPGLPLERMWPYRLEALSQAADEQLLLKEARGRGIPASALGSASEVEAALARLKAKVTPLPSVRDQEVRALYATVATRRILVRRRPMRDYDAAQEAARRRAEDLLRQLHAGADFATLAKAESDDDRTKAAGGLAGAALVVSLEPDEQQALAPLKVGQITGVLPTSLGYEILKLEQRGHALPADYGKLVPQLRAQLASQKQEAAWQAHLAGLRRGVKVAVTDAELRAYELLRAERTEEAIDLLGMASRNPTRLGPAGAASVFFQLGASHARHLRWAEAARDYEACDQAVRPVLHLFPEARLATLFGIGFAYENTGLELRDTQPAAAEEAFGKAVRAYQELGPLTSSPSHHDRLRLSYLRMGRQDLAEQEATWLVKDQEAREEHRKALEAMQQHSRSGEAVPEQAPTP